MSLLKRIQEVKAEWEKANQPEMGEVGQKDQKGSKSPKTPHASNIDGSPLTSNLAPSVWRDQLAGWPIEWRERWGRLANALEDEGGSFPKSEFEAFTRIKREMEAS
jgi:hypothetical protein